MIQLLERNMLSLNHIEQFSFRSFGVQVEVDDGADEDLEDEVQEVVDESDEEEETVGANNIQET